MTSEDSTRDVVEWVARAICRRRYLAEQDHYVVTAVDDFVDAFWGEYISQAESALTACGYHEMREALILAKDHCRLLREGKPSPVMFLSDKIDVALKPKGEA